jgi:hypothetical protein
MSEAQRANVELVQSVARVVEANGPAGLMDIFEGGFHPDFEWHPGIIGLSRISYSGREEFREYLNQTGATSRRVELRSYSSIADAEEAAMALTDA